MPSKPTQHRPAGWKPYDPKQHDERRGTASERGYGNTWRKFRERFLKENPLCRYCLAYHRTTQATVVDHIIPHRGDMQVFWQHGNHQSLCPSCHSSIKQREENANRKKKPTQRDDDGD